MTKRIEKKSLELPAYLRKARERAGLTQKDLSDSLGYSTSQFVSNWENGRSSPPLDALAFLIEILQIDQQGIIEVILSDTKLTLESRIKPKLVASGS